MKRVSRVLIAITLVMLSSILIRQDAGAAYSDVSGHWAEAAITQWSDYGILQGSGGLFRPNDTVTRGELAAILNRILKFDVQPGYSFSDLPAGKWCHDDVIAMAHQRALRFEGEYVYPDEPLQRQEAALMFAQAFQISYYVSNYDKVSPFTDYATAQDWAKKPIYSLFMRGYLSGNPDGTFGPERAISRAEVVTILGNIIDTLITEPGIYDQPLGTSVFVNAEEVTLVSQALAELRIGVSVNHKLVKLNGGTCDKVIAYNKERLMGEYLPTENLSALTSKGKLMNVEQIYPDVDTRFAGGVGTESNPYLIATGDQLQLLNDYYGPIKQEQVHFMLSGNIELEGFWKPLCPFVYPVGGDGFRNVLDGAGYAIHGLDVQIESQNLVQAGLFEIIYVNGVVKNLSVYGNINVKAIIGTQKNKASVEVGGIVGTLDNGTIENCASYVNITVQSDIETYVGGIAGAMIAGNIESSSGHGRIAVQVDSRNADSHAVAGGIVGRGYYGANSLANSYSDGHTEARGGYQSLAAGVVGCAFGNNKINACYAIGTVSASGGHFQNNAGGLTGQIHGATVKNSWAAVKVTVGSKDDHAINVSGGLCSGVYEGALVENCYARSNIREYGIYFLPMSGCLIGSLEGTVKNSYATGTVTVTDEYDDEHEYGVMVASRRGNGGAITQCFDLTGSTYYYVNEPSVLWGDGSITAQQAISKDTFTQRGWDFDSVWRMPNGTDGYRFPLLRSVSEVVQLD